MDHYQEQVNRLASRHPGRSFGPQWVAVEYADLIETNGLGFRISVEELVDRFGKVVDKIPLVEADEGVAVLVVGPLRREEGDERKPVEVVELVLAPDAVEAKAAVARRPDRPKPRRVPGQSGRRINARARRITVPLPDVLEEAAGRPVEAMIAEAPAEIARTAKPRAAARRIPGQPGRRVRSLPKRELDAGGEAPADHVADDVADHVLDGVLAAVGEDAGKVVLEGDLGDLPSDRDAERRERADTEETERGAGRSVTEGPAIE